MKPTVKKYNQLLYNIGSMLQKARESAIKAINTELVIANWEIGRHIVEFEQHGREKAIYGDTLLSNLSNDLKSWHGKGFSKSNLYVMRLFYQKYPIFQTSGISSKSLTRKNQTSGKLTCSPVLHSVLTRKTTSFRHLISTE
jgi:hypothetical protein